MNDLDKINSYCELSKTALTFKKEVTQDQWLSVFNALKQVEGCVQFWIGDALAYRQQRWGMYEGLSEKTGYSENTLREYKQVAENVKNDIRMSDLDFGHHQVVASLEPKQQKEVLKKASDEHLSVRETREEVKKIKRGDDERKQEELPNKKYQVIYADPPWKYDKDEAYFGQDVERHYPVMDKEQLCNLTIGELADKNCVLYMWTTAPKLNWVFDIIKAWGFDYKTCLIWDKVKHNMGFYASIRHEILIIAGKGSSAPDDAKAANQTDSVYVEERTEHSKKPEYYYEMIEKHHPEKKKRIELFARQKRNGWDSWGNENKE